MVQLAIEKWGNAQGIKIPTDMLQAIGVKQGDLLNVEVTNGKLIIEKGSIPKTIHELFKNYRGESFTSNLIDIEPKGHELW